MQGARCAAVVTTPRGGASRIRNKENETTRLHKINIEKTPNELATELTEKRRNNFNPTA